VELEPSGEEFRKDYNRHHFRRKRPNSMAPRQLDPRNPQGVVEFLKQSATSEFSGFLLYKELAAASKEKTPCWRMLAPWPADEAPTPAFLTSRWVISVCSSTGLLTAIRPYTFFQPKFILLRTTSLRRSATGRYIAIYRHLQQHPEAKFSRSQLLRETVARDEKSPRRLLRCPVKAQPDTVARSSGPFCGRFFLLACVRSPCRWRGNVAARKVSTRPG